MSFSLLRSRRSRPGRTIGRTRSPEIPDRIGAPGTRWSPHSRRQVDDGRTVDRRRWRVPADARAIPRPVGAGLPKAAVGEVVKVARWCGGSVSSSERVVDCFGVQPWSTCTAACRGDVEAECLVGGQSFGGHPVKDGDAGVDVSELRSPRSQAQADRPEYSSSQWVARWVSCSLASPPSPRCG